MQQALSLEGGKLSPFEGPGPGMDQDVEKQCGNLGMAAMMLEWAANSNVSA